MTDRGRIRDDDGPHEVNKTPAPNDTTSLPNGADLGPPRNPAKNRHLSATQLLALQSLAGNQALARDFGSTSSVPIQRTAGALAAGATEVLGGAEEGAKLGGLLGPGGVLAGAALGALAAGILTSDNSHPNDNGSGSSAGGDPQLDSNTGQPSPVTVDTGSSAGGDSGGSGSGETQTVSADQNAEVGDNSQSKGSTGRNIPDDLKEQVAMGQAKADPEAGMRLPIPMSDPRWPASEGWVKMSQNVNGVEIHYVYNPGTGVADDWKFK